MDEEVWRDIEGYEGLYQVSDLGRVRSIDRIEECVDGRKRKRNGRTLKQCKSRKGYLRVHLHSNNKGIVTLAHRLVAISFLSNPLAKETVNHKNGVKSDNRAVNLEWATNSENIRHATLNGLRSKGEDRPRSVLTEYQVREIREKYRKGSHTHRSLAKEYGVKSPTITNIINRKTWKHI